MPWLHFLSPGITYGGSSNKRSVGWQRGFCLTESYEISKKGHGTTSPMRMRQLRKWYSDITRHTTLERGRCSKTRLENALRLDVCGWCAYIDCLLIINVHLKIWHLITKNHAQWLVSQQTPLTNGDRLLAIRPARFRTTSAQIKYFVCVHEGSGWGVCFLFI